jgi:hypothetical protein
MQARNRVGNFPMPGNPRMFVQCTTQGAFFQASIVKFSHCVNNRRPSTVRACAPDICPLPFTAFAEFVAAHPSLPQACNANLRWNQRLQNCV